MSHGNGVWGHVVKEEALVWVMVSDVSVSGRGREDRGLSGGEEGDGKN